MQWHRLPNASKRRHEQMNEPILENEVAPGPVFLREPELADRWKTSQRTLQRWRADGFGPAYVLIGGAIRYRFADVIDFERRMSRGGGEA